MMATPVAAWQHWPALASPAPLTSYTAARKLLACCSDDDTCVRMLDALADALACPCCGRAAAPPTSCDAPLPAAPSLPYTTCTLQKTAGAGYDDHVRANRLWLLLALTGLASRHQSEAVCDSESVWWQPGDGVRSHVAARVLPRILTPCAASYWDAHALCSMLRHSLRVMTSSPSRSIGESPPLV